MVRSRQEVGASIWKWKNERICHDQVYQFSFKRIICLKIGIFEEDNLQDPEAKQWFTPYKKVAKVFGNEKMKGFAMTKFIYSHLSEVSAWILAYLQNNILQDPEAKQWFTTDKKLEQVFENEKMKGFAMTKFINFHLSEVSVWRLAYIKKNNLQDPEATCYENQMPFIL